MSEMWLKHLAFPVGPTMLRLLAALPDIYLPVDLVLVLVDASVPASLIRQKYFLMIPSSFPIASRASSFAVGTGGSSVIPSKRYA